MIDGVGASTYWHLITRLGEVQLLLPAALWACLALLHQPGTRLFAVRWLQAIGVAALITTGSKIAFIGWGVGLAAWDFTGVSGHAMFSAAIYPLLLATLACRLPEGWQKASVWASVALVLLVGVSRVMVGAHSVSEVLAGLLLGGAASAFAIWQLGLPRARLNLYVPLVAVVWLAVAPLQAPQVPTHSWVTRASLMLSGHAKPHTRTGMLRGQHAADHGRTKQADLFRVGQ
jgi:membrane-associated phospholipid phosphatase